MDAQKLGAFIARCRKEKNMTQADLAIKLQVTDKAISRWERGVGFPDINTIEPLADALKISVLELMKSERIDKEEFTSEEATEMVIDALGMAKLRRKQERKSALTILAITSVVVMFILFLDNMQWQEDILLFTGVGVAFPLFCICSSAVILGYAIWRKATGKPSGQTFGLAIALLLFIVILLGLLFLAGVLISWPVST